MNEIIPESEFKKLDYWSRLPVKVQRDVFQASQEFEFSWRAGIKLDQGRCATVLKELLFPYGLYRRHTEEFHRKAQKTVARRALDWEIAMNRLPRLFVAVVREQGVDLGELSEAEPYGKFTEAVNRLGGVRKTDAKHEMISFVQKMQEEESALRGERSRSEDVPPPMKIIFAMFKHVQAQIKRLPKNQRRLALRYLLGFLLGEFGLKSMGSIEAMELPDELKAN